MNWFDKLIQKSGHKWASVIYFILMALVIGGLTALVLYLIDIHEGGIC